MKRNQKKENSNTKLIIGNMKMNILDIKERENYFSQMKKALIGKKIKITKLILCPPAVHIESFAKNFQKSNISIGAQNIHFETKGSFTGEISPLMMKNLGCEYALVGHSERRRYYQESDEMINKKIVSAIKNNLIPVLCVGETREERDGGLMQKIIKSQVEKALRDINQSKVVNVVIAYEPVWAIGAEKPPTANEIMEARLLIKKILVRMLGENYANKILILYGGSVNVKTVKGACLDPGADGVLVGRESLLPQELVKIAEIIDSGCDK